MDAGKCSLVRAVRGTGYEIAKHMSFFAEPFLLLGRYKYLLLRTTSSEIKARYAGTLMGIAWALIYPLLFLALYAVVYVAIFNVRFGEMKSFDYVLLIFAGLIPFLNFTEMLAVGVVSVTSNSTLIKNTLFPIELVPVKAVLASTLTMLISLGILECALICTGKFSLINFLVIPVIALQLVFSFGLSWLLSALNVFLKDIGQIIPIVSLFLMLVSPIAYTMDMVPKALVPFMYLNPLFYMISLYRGVLLDGEVPWGPLASFLGISMFMFYFGFFVFIG